MFIHFNSDLKCCEDAGATLVAANVARSCQLQRSSRLTVPERYTSRLNRFLFFILSLQPKQMLSQAIFLEVTDQIQHSSHAALLPKTCKKTLVCRNVGVPADFKNYNYFKNSI